MKLTINFSLKTGVSGEIPVLAILNYGNKEYDVQKHRSVYKPLKYYTGITLKREQWDAQKKIPVQKTIQTKLLKMEQQIRDVFQFVYMSGEITAEKLKNALNEKIKGKKTDTVIRVRLVDFISQHVVKDYGLNVNTHGRYGALSGHLLKLEEKIGKQVYSNEFNERYYLLFLEIIREQANRNNSVFSTVSLLAATLRKIAEKYKVPVFSIKQDAGDCQKITQTDTEKVYLKFHELQKLIEHEPKTKSQRNIKLIMLTLAFTGVRFSDVFKVQPEFVYNDGEGVCFRYARFVTQKGINGQGKEVIIPILKPLEDAIAQNGGETAYRVAKNHFNQEIKVLFRNCGFDEEHTLSFTDEYGKIQFETKKFYEFVSSHIGRRSFITNLINHIQWTVLAKITTHSASRGSSTNAVGTSVIFTYNQTTLLENAVLFVEAVERLHRDNPKRFPLRLI